MNDIGNQLLKSLQDVNEESQIISEKYDILKRELISLESILINLKIRKSRLIEEIRLFRNSTINSEITEREQDIERFRQKLPELLEKIK